MESKCCHFRILYVDAKSSVITCRRFLVHWASKPYYYCVTEKSRSEWKSNSKGKQAGTAEISGCVLVSERNGLEPAAKGYIIFKVNARQHTLNQFQVVLGISQLTTVKCKLCIDNFFIMNTAEKISWSITSIIHRSKKLKVRLST